MWLEILEHMVNYFTALDTFGETNVQGGTDGKKPNKFPSLHILRDMEAGIDFHARKSADVILWVECWVRNDSKDPMEAYRQLYDLEQRFLEAMPGWIKQVAVDLKIAPKITIPHFVGDGERQRPLCGSQATIIINWKR